MSYAVIQGSSKGIGLAITRHLLKHTKLNIVGTTSSGSSSARAAALKGLESHGGAEERLTTLSLDVTDESSIEKASKGIKEKFGENMRLLVNVSGMLHAEKSLAEVDLASLTKSFQINTFGHLLVYKHFVSLIPPRQNKHTDSASIFHDEGEDPAAGILPKDKSTLVSFTARVGSIGDNEKGGWYSYRSSKAATNQIIRTLAHELSNRSIPARAFAYHPGTVQTALSEPYVGSKKPDEKHGLFEPEKAAEKFVEVLKKSAQGEIGGFVDWKGEKVVW